MKRIKRLWLLVTVCRNFFEILLSKIGGTPTAAITRSGAVFKIGNWNSNLISLLEVYGEKQYGDAFKGIVVDIGANIGAFSVFAAEAGATVYAYEPEPKNYELLVENARGRKIKTFPFAVGGERGERTLFLTGEYSGKNSFYPPSPALKQVTVRCVSLEDILHEVGSCDTLKIDCEGAEYEILYRLPQALFSRIGEIRLEWHAIQGERVEDLILYLDHVGFEVARPHLFPSILYAVKKK